MPKYGTLEHPALSCYDLSLADDKMKTSKLSYIIILTCTSHSRLLTSHSRLHSRTITLACFILIRSLGCSCTHSLACLLARSLTHLLTHSPTHSLTCLLAHSLTLSLAHSHSLTCSLTHSLTHPLTHSLTHLLACSFNHSLTHSHSRLLTLTHSHSRLLTLTHSLTHSHSHLLTHLLASSITDTLTHSFIALFLTTDTTYYVDPNGGSPEDAFEVICRKMELYQGWFTCIKPRKSIMVSDTITRLTTIIDFVTGIQW